MFFFFFFLELFDTFDIISDIFDVFLTGIALSACGCTLYYTPLASIHLFSISAAHLRDFGQGGSSKSFALANTTIQRLGLKEAPSDGMTFDCAGTLIYGGT